MNPSPHPARQNPGPPCQPLAKRLHSILAAVPLAENCKIIQETANELGVGVLECAAALLHLLQPDAALPCALPSPTTPPETLKMVRYRLDIGIQHHLSTSRLKQTLVAESGVNINHIGNVSIRANYTLVDLPDAMPQDIYQHLKTVEIDGRKLAIKRVKRRKKRPHTHHSRAKTGGVSHDQPVAGKQPRTAPPTADTPRP